MAERLTEKPASEADDAAFAVLVEKISAKVQVGEDFDVEAYAHDHPEHAERLRQLLPAIQALAGIGVSLSGGGSSQPATKTTESVSGELGDFRIIREIGRGGMGVVYEAEQISLKRRVALKVLPFAAVLDPRQLQRFKNEAQAAASLKHPNIVGVHSVGCERGVHYYAMEYVEGQTLAAVIHELRQDSGLVPEGEEDRAKPVSQVTRDLTSGAFALPGKKSSGERPAADFTTETPKLATAPEDTDRPPQAAVSAKGSTRSPEFFRSVAVLGIQAAEALEHAHQMGVVHRDIKPSNLMVDASGHLWITDFGLAITHAETNLTMTGDILGTLRYMSPEQAEGKNRILDHHTDIYSLGVTQYELLTLTPAFDGDNRHSVIHRIIDGDPRPLRQLNPSIPKDLETIVAKAMATEPEGRYATAQEWADDLKRFLDHEPIRARRPSLVERTMKWSRRHLAIVWSAVLLLILSIIGLGVSTYLIAQERTRVEDERARTEKAYVSEKSARKLAVRQRDIANWNLYLAHMRLAQQDWESGQTWRFQKVLDRHVPKADEPDVRGWEWYYLWSLACDDWLMLRGHTDGVRLVRWSPDGKHLASGGGQGTARVWDAKTGHEVLKLDGHIDLVWSIAWSPDGGECAGVDGGDVIKIWNTTTWQVVRTLQGHSGAIHSVAWSSDGRWLASASTEKDDKTVRIWDAAGGREILALAAGDGPLCPMLVSPDGGRLAWLSGEKTVRIWSGDKTKEPVTLDSHAPLVWWAMGWSPRGEYFSCPTFDMKILIWDAASGELVATLSGHTEFVEAAVWSPDGRRLASASRDKTIRLWDATTGEQLVSQEEHIDWGLRIVWSPNGENLVSGGRDGAIHLLDAANARRVMSLRGHTGAIWSLAWSPDGRRLASGANSLRVWNIFEEGKAILQLTDGQRVESVAWSPGSRHLAAGSSDGAINICDLDSRKTTLTLEGHKGGVLSVGWSEDGERLASAGADGTLRVWDRSTGKEVLSWRGHDVSATSLAWSPDSRRLASAGDDEEEGTVKIWDASTGKRLRTLRGHGRTPRSVAFSPDGRQIASSGDDATVRVWEVSSGNQIFVRNITAPGWRDMIASYCVAWSPDGERIATGCADETVRIWRPSSDREPIVLHGHTGRVYSVAWNPDGDRLVSAGADETVRIWDARTGEEILTFRDHRGDHRSIAWSPDGLRLASGSENGTVRVWDASRGYEMGPAYLVQRAQRLSAAGEYQESVAILRKLGDDFPDEPNYRKELADLLIGQNRHDEASAMVQKLMDEFPNTPDYWKASRDHLTYIYTSQGHGHCEKSSQFRDTAYWDTALAFYNRALRLDPECSGAYFGRGAIYNNRNEFDRAIRECNEAIRLDPRSALTRSNRGVAYTATGEFDKAMADFNEAVRLEPKNDLFRYNRGSGHVRKGDSDKAMADFNESIRLNSGRSHAYYGRGVVYYKKGEFDKAVAEHTEAIRLKPRFVQAYCHRALAYARLGRIEDASSDVEKALKADSGWPDSDDAKAWFLATSSDARLRDADRAVKLATGLVQEYPTVSDYWKTLGAAQYRAGQWDEARLALEKSIELGSASHVARRFFLAMAHWQLGDQEESRKQFDQAAGWMDEKSPNHEPLGRFRAEAAELLGINQEKEE